jgi:2-dehydropantoate 2-reductase
MRVLCFGAGAIGSLVGARLSLRGIDVTVLGRRAHVAAIRTHGLILEAPHERLACKEIDSITTLDDLAAPPDLVLLTVKAYDTRAALEILRPVLHEGVRILSLQNGIGNEELIATVAGADRTVAGSITISARCPRPGVVRQNSAVGGIAVAPVDPRQDPADLVALFKEAGLSAQLHRDFRAMKWSKLLLNMFTNATAAILDLPPVEVVDHPGLFRVERDAFREACRVMRALGLRPVTLPGYPVPLWQAAVAAPPWMIRPVLRRYIRRGRGEGRPSLWQDLQRGRPQSEVEVLNGAVVQEGGRLGVPTPVNAVLTEVLVGLAGGRRDPGQFRHRPEALLALLNRGSRSAAPPQVL